MFNNNDTICAIATPQGTGAIAVIRISGNKSFEVIHQIFKPKNENINLLDLEPYKVYYGEIYDKNQLIDDVLISVFKAPHSYTGEHSLEISCHGSPYIQRLILELLVSKGIRLAEAGEFTLRAFLNGKMDLTQAEAVADLIASQSKTMHELALKQMRGGFSNKITELRKQLLDFASLIELELDFSEEDVEFADRTQLFALLANLKEEVNRLLESFKLGNAIKNGIPVAIIGKPNAGKSTLLNALLNEEKAIVSEIPGTTRDTIEDTIMLRGTAFRFIDTAGLRTSDNPIENIGIERTHSTIEKSFIILYLIDICNSSVEEILEEVKLIKTQFSNLDKHVVILANKTDMLEESPKELAKLLEQETIFISAKRKENINLITEALLKVAKWDELSEQLIMLNVRHYAVLLEVQQSIANIEKAFADKLSSELIAIDIKNILHYLGEITGEITNDEILGNIFGHFCIGK